MVCGTVSPFPFSRNSKPRRTVETRRKLFSECLPSQRRLWLTVRGASPVPPPISAEAAATGGWVLGGRR